MSLKHMLVIEFQSTAKQLLSLQSIILLHFIFNLNNTLVLKPTKKILQDLQSGINTKDTEGRGWKVLSIDQAFLNISEFTPLTGSSYSEPLEFIKRKNAILNVYNEDDRCFLFSFLALLYPTETNKSNYQSYEKFTNRLDMSMLNFPVKIDSTIINFEKANLLIVNIYSEEDNNIVIVRISPAIDDV